MLTSMQVAMLFDVLMLLCLCLLLSKAYRRTYWRNMVGSHIEKWGYWQRCCEYQYHNSTPVAVQGLLVFTYMKCEFYTHHYKFPCKYIYPVSVVTDIKQNDQSYSMYMVACELTLQEQIQMGNEEH